MADIQAFTARQLSAAIHARHLSCREVMQSTLAQIERINPLVNAIVSLRDGDALLADADTCDTMLARGNSMGWMHGMPQAIKDISPAKGLPNTMGSPLLRDNIPSADGLMAQRMKANGAIVIGKTNTPEFGLGSHTFNTVFGPTHNPYAMSKTPGGSSGGAAVALATRMLAVADGSDSMGSLRNPAAWCNVFGFRPSFGRVPMWPAADVWINHFGTEGPMARHVADLRMLLQVQAGRDPRLPFSIAQAWQPPRADQSKVIAINPMNPVTNGQFGIKNPVPALKIGWLGNLDGHLAIESGIEPLCEQALANLQLLGHQVDAARIPMSPQRIWQAWLVWRKLIVASRLAPFLTHADNRRRIKPEALWEFDQAKSLSATAFAQASVDRSDFHAAMSKLFERFDVLAIPSAQVWPFDIATRSPKAINGRAMDTYHRWMECTLYATFAGLPAISVPVGFSGQGLPMGMQLIGKPQADAQVLDLAQDYEATIGDIVARQPSVLGR